MSFWIEIRYVDSVGTCMTFLRTNDGFSLTSPFPATVIREPFVVAIFLQLGHGE